MNRLGWHAVPAIVLISLFLAAAALTGGCGGSGGSAEGGAGALPPADHTAALNRMAALATVALQGDAPGVGGSMALLQSLLAAGMDDILLEPETFPEIPLPVGVIDTTLYGLHIAGAWLYTNNPLNIGGSMTVNGTVSGSGTQADGLTIQATATANVVNGNGHITASGDVTTPTQGTFHVTLDETLGLSGSMASLHTVATVTQGGVTLYAADVTRTLDQSAPRPRPRTINGTVTVRDPAVPGSQVTVTFTNLVYVVAQEQQTVSYVSGTVRLTDASGLTATLTVQPDGSLYGPVTTSQGTVIGYMTVRDGNVTVTAA